MKSITIHGLDDTLDKRIRETAKRKGISLNKTIKKLLEKALGINQEKQKDHRGDYMDLFGTWSEEELKEFNNATSDSRKIDRGDWD
jgi:plasmid stability protein